LLASAHHRCGHHVYVVHLALTGISISSAGEKIEKGEMRVGIEAFMVRFWIRDKYCHGAIVDRQRVTGYLTV
jgi:hypothetical protein